MTTGSPGMRPARGFREFKVIIGDRSRPVEDRRRALRFLVHLVEDLHQPLHVGENHDKGGNNLQVRWFDRGSNLHRVWDSEILERASRDEARCLDDLIAMDTPEARRKTHAGSVEDLATESLLAARYAYEDPSTGRRMEPGAKLACDYQSRNLPVAKRRLYQAGVRLGRVLNEAFP
jgi:hypothetical protein